MKHSLQQILLILDIFYVLFNQIIISIIKNEKSKTRTILDIIHQLNSINNIHNKILTVDINNVNNWFFVEETTFTTCKTTNYYGGGIYFCNTANGQCVIFHTCSFNCSSKRTDSSSTYGQYAYIRTKNNDAGFKNEVNETTITGSKNESTYPWCALDLEYSNIICSSVNITNNECYYYPALYCYPASTTYLYTCSIIYTSIVNNSAKGGYGCIWLHNSGSKQFIFTSNIINNKQDSSNYATIRTNGHLFINESCIIGNNENDQKVFFMIPIQNRLN